MKLVDVMKQSRELQKPFTHPSTDLLLICSSKVSITFDHKTNKPITDDFINQRIGNLVNSDDWRIV